jgi:hypothetical protein
VIRGGQLYTSNIFYLENRYYFYHFGIYRGGHDPISLKEVPPLLLSTYQVIAFTILRYRNLKKPQVRDKREGVVGKVHNVSFSLLLEAWNPYVAIEETYVQVCELLF